MIQMPLTVVIIIGVIVVVLFLARVGLQQDRAVRNVPPRPGTTSVLAIVAFIVAFLVPPIGVILGHTALYRIGIGKARGRHWADGALGVGYFLIIIEVILFLLWYMREPWF